MSWKEFVASLDNPQIEELALWGRERLIKHYRAGAQGIWRVVATPFSAEVHKRDTQRSIIGRPEMGRSREGINRSTPVGHYMQILGGPFYRSG